MQRQQHSRLTSKPSTPQSRWRARNPEKVRAFRREYERRPEVKARTKRQLKARRRKFPERYRLYARRASDKMRLEVFTHYCGGRPHCQCPGCRVKEIAFLTMQHLNGGGCRQRKRLGWRVYGPNLYRWLKDHGYPKGYAVFCANCNMADARREGCPHRRAK